MEVGAAIPGADAGQAAAGAAAVRVGSTLEQRTKEAFWDQVEMVTGSQVVVIDLRSVLFVDHAGLRALVSAVRRLRAGGGRAWLRCPPGPVRSRLVAAGLDRLVPIRPDRPGVVAVRSRRSAAAGAPRRPAAHDAPRLGAGGATGGPAGGRLALGVARGS